MTPFTPPARRSRKASYPAAASRCSRAKQAVGKLKDENPDIQAGINIVLKALEAPIRQIAENSGVEGSIVVGRITDNKSQTFGFNAQTEEYVDMLQAGIVDPAKVVRAALQGAASVAGLLITTEAMIAEAPEEGDGSGDAGRRRHGRHGRHGLLSPASAIWSKREGPDRKGRRLLPLCRIESVRIAPLLLSAGPSNPCTPTKEISRLVDIRTCYASEKSRLGSTWEARAAVSRGPELTEGGVAVRTANR